MGDFSRFLNLQMVPYRAKHHICVFDFRFVFLWLALFLKCLSQNTKENFLSSWKFLNIVYMPYILLLVFEIY